MSPQFTRRALIGFTAVAALAAGCSNADPMATSSPSATTGASETAAATTITVGSARFPEAEIIAELYAQTLEADGITVKRNMQIGARETYIAAIKDGSVDLLPEYTGNLLQFWDPKTTAKSPEDVLSQLRDNTPEGLRVLDPSSAEDKDSWVVTSDFSSKNKVTSLADLSTFGGKLRLAGNPELAERPYGPKGLTDIYGVPAANISFTPIDDGGGPLTVQALVDGDVDLADIYSTTPAIAENNFVVLEDPLNMIVSQQVFALASEKVPASADERLNAVSKALTTDDLIAMNARNQGDEKASPSTIAADWLKEKGLI
ncbi:glycine betaine ABC transporter substrate-binding protein [Tessaracoccus antarcticus]|uniref:ABC transporter substrate-binding protein n=1 Tax=Tessaracoccus antarcticus TaxID=2479848 RepID=A0A3M0G903_9ACTN|nr:ABC transporter substrate-binding protein [Tessaracoccus antarcticus]RMB61530.1 ABC transporter substrate-binding protein [Tessaracoccus antarcticus]